MKKNKKNKNRNAEPDKFKDKSEIGEETEENRQSKPFLQNEQILIGIIILATALVYFNSLNNRFVYDDWFQIERNPLILSWENAPQLLTQSVWQFLDSERSAAVSPYYRPVFSFSLLVNYQLFGLNVVNWHLFSVLFHLAATLLVYFLAKKWSDSIKIAAISAFIFGIHPIHTEAVAWASASTELLLGFFTLASILLYEKAREKQRWLWLSLSAVAAFLAMGSKETGIMIPAFFVVREAISFFDNKQYFNLKDSLIGISPFVVCAAIYLGLRYSALGFISVNHPLASDISAFQTVLTIPYILFEYIRLNIFPYPLAFIYDYHFIESFADLKFWIGITAIAGTLYLVYRFGRDYVYILFSAAIFFVFLAPALNLKLFNPYQSILQDRYLYLPSAGFCIIAGFFLNWLVGKFYEKNEIPLLIVAISVGIIFGGLTVYQNSFWQNDFVLTEHALKYAPERAFLHTQYGDINAEQGNFIQAEKSLKKAIELGENLPNTYKSLGFVYAKQNKFAEAEEALKNAVKSGSAENYVWINLGIVQNNLGKLDEAESALKTAQTNAPNNPIVLYSLGSINEKRENTAQAEKYYRETLNVRPDFSDARLSLAILLSKQNRVAEAIEQIDIVKSQNPDNPDTLLALGGIQLQNRQCGKAVETFNQLAKLQPAHKRVYVNLGLAYECLDKTDDAKRSFQKAIEVAPESPTTEIARQRLEVLNK